MTAQASQAGPGSAGTARTAPAGTPARGAALARALVSSTWFWPAAATAAICSWRMGRISLWWDELTTYDVAGRGFSQILRTIRAMDGVHGVYYLFMHVWMLAFGTGAVALRLPGVLAATGAAVAVALTAKHLDGHRAGVAAGLVFALIPAVARYSTEVRSYALAMFAAALSTLLLLRALEKPAARRWTWYALALATAGLLNLIALTVAAGHLAAVLIHARAGGKRAPVARFAAAVSGAIVLCLPVIYLGHRQAARQIGRVPEPTLSQFASMWPQIVCSTAGCVLLLLLLASAWGRRPRRIPALVSAVAVLPVPVVWAASFGGESYFYFARYLLFAVPGLAVAAGLGAARIRGIRTLAAVVAVLAIAVSGDQLRMHGTFAHFWFNYPGDSVPGEDYRSAAAFVAAGYRPGDGASFPGRTDLTEGVGYYLPPAMRMRDILVAETSAQVDDEFPVACPDLRACAEAGPDRVWLFVPGAAASPWAALPAAYGEALQTVYHQGLIHHVKGITVVLLLRDP